MLLLFVRENEREEYLPLGSFLVLKKAEKK